MSVIIFNCNAKPILAGPTSAQNEFKRILKSAIPNEFRFFCCYIVLHEQKTKLYV